MPSKVGAPLSSLIPSTARQLTHEVLPEREVATGMGLELRGERTVDTFDVDGDGLADLRRSTNKVYGGTAFNGQVVDVLDRKSHTLERFFDLEGKGLTTDYEKRVQGRELRQESAKFTFDVLREGNRLTLDWNGHVQRQFDNRIGEIEYGLDKPVTLPDRESP